MSKKSIGDVLERLFTTIESRREADPKSSYTAQLLHSGIERCAKKFGEEAVEAALAGVGNDKSALTAEAADVLYHLLVLLAARDVTLEEVASALQAREGISGIDEKASRS